MCACRDLFVYRTSIGFRSNPMEMMSLTLNITADLQSLFTWNTKQVFAFVAAECKTSKNSLNQVSLWDAIIPEKENNKFWIQISNKYRFIDQVLEALSLITLLGKSISDCRE
uniref:Signal peptidase complex subunit 3 n=1 Tax=Brassica oleracea TaxID=3712 RepID=A0A3P6DZL6_BRAOL|nr:unnamed protein product [Brassica oleracea]